MTGIRRGLLAAAGNGGGGFAVHVEEAPTSDSTISITHPLPGHTGTLTIYLVGSTSKTPIYYTAGSDTGYNGSGESAVFTYNLQGDETSFSLRQLNYNATGTEELRLSVVGGVNDGKYVRVGSARGNATGYGNGGACVNLSGSNTLSVTRNAYGGFRYRSNTLYYTDATSYGPDNYATYGDSPAYYEIDGDANALELRHGDNTEQYSARYRADSGSPYTEYAKVIHNNTAAGGVSGGRRSGVAGHGVAILVFE